MFTGKQLADYCEKVYRAGWVYWYGTYGKKCSQSLYEGKKRQYPAHYTQDRTAGYMKDIAGGRTCADCVGMIKSFFWTGGAFGGEPRYAANHCPDTSANGMIALCAQTGPIRTIPDEPGLVVWKSGHIGVYVGGGYTVEMKGFAYDCVRNRVTAGPWTKWGRLPASMIAYEQGTGEDGAPGDLRNGCVGEDVRRLQLNLICLGFDCGRWGADGEFGDCTELAVIAFQRARGLDGTGVFDAAARAAMDAALGELDAPVTGADSVEIVGGNCYVRTEPDVVLGAVRGVAREGERLDWLNETSAAGWQKVAYRNGAGWVSGKYSRLVPSRAREA